MKNFVSSVDLLLEKILECIDVINKTKVYINVTEEVQNKNIREC